MMQNPYTPQRPDVRHQIDNFYLTSSRDPLVMAILQAVQQQKLEEAAKGKVLQSLGYGQNALPMGAIPRGHSILMEGGQAYTRPGQMNPQFGQLVQALLGIKQGGTFEPPVTPNLGSTISNIASRAKSAEGTGNIAEMDFLRRMYPELFGGL